ncbi:DNA-3-methyladenine glycosylase [Thermophagus sp. OGC60D27]|uniref:DNA-3-methyladenine glycosylase n=1 Tax=Thermophagus sp. OGC60D27 TaxID=3458415 RepID=UPI0040384B6F
MRLSNGFFCRDVLEVAPDLIGKILVRKFDDGEILRLTINETEAYREEEDLACHASRGRTPRTEVMYHKGGLVYVYFIYGMYWLLNFTTGAINHPQAVLIRGTREINGPGRLGRTLKLDRSFYGEDLTTSGRLWVEESPASTTPTSIITKTRVGINYAGEFWANKPWRFMETS